MATKYVDIKKIDENGNILITKSLTPSDIEAINKIGVAANDNTKNITKVNQKLSHVQSESAANISAVNERVSNTETNISSLVNVSDGLNNIKLEGVESDVTNDAKNNQLFFVEGTQSIFNNFNSAQSYTVTLADGTTQTLRESGNTPVNINYGDGTTGSITLKQLVEAFKNAETE